MYKDICHALQSSLLREFWILMNPSLTYATLAAIFTLIRRRNLPWGWLLNPSPFKSFRYSEGFYSQPSQDVYPKKSNSKHHESSISIISYRYTIKKENATQIPSTLTISLQNHYPYNERYSHCIPISFLKPSLITNKLRPVNKPELHLSI